MYKIIATCIEHPLWANNTCVRNKAGESEPCYS